MLKEAVHIQRDNLCMILSKLIEYRIWSLDLQMIQRIQLYTTVVESFSMFCNVISWTPAQKALQRSAVVEEVELYYPNKSSNTTIIKKHAIARIQPAFKILLRDTLHA